MSRKLHAMSERQFLLAARPPLALPWQLSVPASGFLLLGWSMPPAYEAEAGMPERVCRLIARALLRVGVVTYPRSSEPPSSLETRSKLLRPRGLSERVRAIAAGAPQEFWSVTTSDAELVRELFEDAGFPWWLQGQVALVSSAAAALDVDRESLLALMDPASMPTPGQLAALGALAMLRPGVDGDVAVIFSVNAPIEEQIVRSLRAEAVELEFDWLELPEGAFASALTASGPVDLEHRLTRDCD